MAKFKSCASVSSSSSTPRSKAVKARERAQKELRTAQRKMSSWKRKAEDLQALEARPSKSLKAIVQALQALPQLEPLEPRTEPPVTATEPPVVPVAGTQRRRTRTPSPSPAPEKDEVRCDGAGVVKLSLSFTTRRALQRLHSLLRRFGAAPDPPATAATTVALWRRGAAVPPAVRPRMVELPVVQHRESFLEAVAKHPVLIVQGATGCGKTTQLPQYLLEEAAAQKTSCRILVTQPRRVSCISVAKRVAYERDEMLGTSVGYAIRHESQQSDSTCLTYCTQGVMLRWLEADPDLRDTTHIFADEVHERSVEGDLLLLLLQQLSRRRPELRIIAMSATLESQRLRRYFDDGEVLKLPGKMFPVKTLFLEDALELTKHQVEQLLPNRNRVAVSRYKSSTKYSGAPDTLQPMMEDLSNHVVQQRYGHRNYSASTRSALCAMDPNVVNFDLAAEVLRYFLSQDPPQSPHGPQSALLVFLSGAKEIERMRSALLEACPELKKEPANSWILNLHSSLQQEDQQLVFDRPPGKIRKIILATNIAETSVTIDDVGVVIDTGHVKELRYDSGRRVASLEDVFECRSSARQRCGRAGRVAPGICVHLVTKYCHDQLMEEHQEPEVRRVPLEELLLRIYAAGLNEMLKSSSEACHALLDPPDQGSVSSALRQLTRLGFLSSNMRSLTPLGHRARRLPLAPHRAKLALLGMAFGAEVQEAAVSAAAALNAASWPFLGAGACSSSFDRGNRHFEARRVHRQIAEEVSGGMGCSDLLGVLRAFGEWHAETSSAERRRAATAWHLRSSALQEIEETRLQLLDLLQREMSRRGGGQGHSHTSPVALGGKQQTVTPMLVGLLTAASFPQMALALPKETLSSSLGSGPVMSELFVDHKGSWVPVQVHPSSISAKEKIFGTPYVLYEELSDTSRLYLRCITCVPPVTALLFANLLSELKEQMQCTVLGEEALLKLGVLKVLLPKSLAHEILELRHYLEAFLRHTLFHGTESDPKTRGSVEEALMEVLRQPFEMLP